MKIRSGFVSNSSSSSFVIPKDKITALQLDQIVNHIEEGKKYNMDCCDDGSYWNWDINTNGHVVCGDTLMDNFDMREFLNYIGVDPNVVRWI